MENKVERKPIVGLVTMLVIFSVLCLTILSVLSFSTAKYEKTLVQKNADAVSAYYIADTWATKATNEIYSTWVNNGDLATVVSKYGGAISNSNDNCIINLACEIDDSRLLNVSISVGSEFEILSWNTVPSTQWQADEKLHVWNPSET